MPDAKPNPPQGNLQVHLDDAVAEGHYANLVLITHSPVEFVLDFARVVPGSPKAKVQTRVILAAAHAKNLLRALEENIKKYESNYGEIKHPGSGGSNKFGFQD
jgi:hypothetical protein